MPGLHSSYLCLSACACPLVCLSACPADGLSMPAMPAHSLTPLRALPVCLPAALSVRQPLSERASERAREERPDAMQRAHTAKSKCKFKSIHPTDCFCPCCYWPCWPSWPSCPSPTLAGQQQYSSTLPTLPSYRTLPS
ncbi:hypothetical protein CC78DRAFT_232339 [Lojkania enalia]|uniref:Uncharacterized protein n=1 Tax=Lojkania enalia TaxID=147567 RepID=A0A9P4MZZ9_9PLEO|nr:hypothetical protein CC78DRAFT_232339 [Didymosphaeria enalia]